jgi:hypothetical protein
MRSGGTFLSRARRPPRVDERKILMSINTATALVERDAAYAPHEHEELRVSASVARDREVERPRPKRLRKADAER